MENLFIVLCLVFAFVYFC